MASSSTLQETAVMILHPSQLPKISEPLDAGTTNKVWVVVPSTVERAEEQRIRALVEASPSLLVAKGVVISEELEARIVTEFTAQIEGRGAGWSWRDYIAILLGAGAVGIWLVYKKKETTISTKHVVTAVSVMAAVFSFFNRRWLRQFKDLKEMVQTFLPAFHRVEGELAHDHDVLALLHE